MTSSEETVERVADLAARHGVTVAAAESLTSGLIASRLGAGPNASEWFRGSVVAYQEPVKFEVLGVREGPVVSARCAADMALGVSRLLGADAAVSSTGVGGPAPEEGEPAGTVFLAVALRGAVTGRELRLDSEDPDEILDHAATAAVELLAGTLADLGRG
jgi:nicotinamide-nucleotide amidase